MTAYRRIVLKLSGETLTEKGAGACYVAKRVDEAARMLVALQNDGAQLAVVFGGGNIWRGRFSEDMNPVNADQMGMLATVMNALCVQDAIARAGGRARVFTAQEMTRFANLYTAQAASDALEHGEIALLAGGSGNPFFTTDTAAVIRAAELRADVVFKGTNVDGVYDSDPNKNPDAKLIPDISYQDAVARGLHVMDITSFQLCREQNVPAIRVFSMRNLDNILKVARGEPLGTVVHA